LSIDQILRFTPPNILFTSRPATRTIPMAGPVSLPAKGIVLWMVNIPSLQNTFFYDFICYCCRQERTSY
jgi:hypothetical protein